jgi:hypothetical protein
MITREDICRYAADNLDRTIPEGGTERTKDQIIAYQRKRIICLHIYNIRLKRRIKELEEAFMSVKGIVIDTITQYCHFCKEDTAQVKVKKGYLCLSCGMNPDSIMVPDKESK